MPIVNEKELIEQAKKRKTASGVEIKTIGDTQTYAGAGGLLYSTYGEALDSLQAKRTVDEYKRLGLNELGQTPEQAARAKRRIEKIKAREELVKKLYEMDKEIAGMNVEEKKSDKPKKK